VFSARDRQLLVLLMKDLDVNKTLFSAKKDAGTSRKKEKYVERICYENQI
jgi:hypothetical protein